MATLYCSGKNSYSPENAMVSMFGETKSIDEWYLLSKRVTKGCAPGVYAVPFELTDGYGLKPDYFEINNIRFENKDLSKYYLFLYYMHFLQNPNKLARLKKYSKFVGKQGDGTVNKPGKTLRYFANGLRRGATAAGGNKYALKRVHNIIKPFITSLFTLDPQPPVQPILDGDNDISFVPGTIGYPA